MKRILVVVCAVAIGVSAISASAQIPNVGVFFDENFKTMWADCPNEGPLTVLDTCYVVAHNLNMWVGSIEYAIDYPPYMYWTGDFVPDEATEENPDGVLVIGNSEMGISIVYPIPRNGFVGMMTQLSFFFWNCTGCNGDPTHQTVVVIPNPSSGQLRALQWPDLAEVPLVGMTSDLCAPVPVEETTWGGIKALYD